MCFGYPVAKGFPHNRFAFRNDCKSFHIHTRTWKQFRDNGFLRSLYLPTLHKHLYPCSDYRWNNRSECQVPASTQPLIGLKEDNTYTSPLRSPLEPAKHKILDIIGDLHLTGKNPLGFKAHIIAKLAGHKSHIEFAKKIIKEL